LDRIITQLAAQFGQKTTYIENVVRLIDEGNTIPFIARYRKELHGSMDDQLLRGIGERLQYLRNLEERRGEMLASIENQGKLTEELKNSIENAATLAELEDIYRPYRQKRRARATAARERGLEPLADLLFRQDLKQGDIYEIAARYIDPEKGVETAEDALAGAGDIIAEKISDDAGIRKELRELISRRGSLVSKAATEEDSVYRLYYDFSSPLGRFQSHQVLAINRGEKEKLLKVSVQIDADMALNILRRRVLHTGSISTEFVENAAKDGYSRLIFPSVEREIRNHLTDMASEQAIRMFGLNLKQLLMQPPVKNKVVMGIDPAYRTGCKVAVVDATGKPLETAVIYPTPPNNRTEEAREILTGLIRRHGVEVIAIGNGTASKETEIFVADMLRELEGVAYTVVSEAGASVYSASKLGAAEFPDYDVSLRSAVSIARRLQDPLAELVKIDPKSIGVGQYQHDMPPRRLDETLKAVVEDCVNGVVVDLNTASTSLLTYISGLTETTARNIVAYREQNGIFKSRNELKKVPKIGPKAFEQCAGFLRVPESGNILDNTGVHPESYIAAERMLEICGYSLLDVARGKAGGLKRRAEELGLEKVALLCGVGVPTVKDIIEELLKPGRDPRDELPAVVLRRDVLDIKDLKPGMIIQGTVRNIVDFGAFVDIGVHQDGLVHISELSHRYVRHPSEVLKVGDIVNTVVLAVDVEKSRISLSIKQAGR
jgi:uncharacterized protein